MRARELCRPLGAAVILLAAGAGGCFRFGFDPPPPDEAGADLCGNFVDDDLDGLVDCSDPGCGPACEGCMPAICVPGFGRCLEGNQIVQECDPSGTLFCPVGTCGDDQVCAGLTCVAPECGAGLSTCTPDGRVQRCLAGTLVVEDCPPSTVCDPAAADSCVPVACTPGLYCSGPTEVSACSPLGVNLGPVEVCSPSETCTAGVCSGPCDVSGTCDYLLVGLDNIATQGTSPHQIYFANGGPSAGVAIQVLDQGAWVNLVSTTAAGGSTTEVSVPNRHVEGTELVPGYAYRVVTEAPMLVRAGFGATKWGDYSAAMVALWPIALFGTDYRLVTMPGNDSDEYWGGDAAEHRGGVAVVAPYDGTLVTVTATAVTLAGAGIPALGPGDPYVVVLNEGDVFQLESASVGDDLTGTRVEASLPVGVFGFHECASVDPQGCDAMGEMLPPVDRWGSTHVVAIPPGTGFGGAPPTRIRVVAATPGTLVDFLVTGASGVLPGPTTLDAGGSVELLLTAMDAGVPGQVFVTASAPVLVAAIHGVEPSLVVVRPLGAELYETTFTGDGLSETLLLSGTGAPVTLDGGTFLVVWEAGAMGTAAAAVESPQLSAGFHRLEMGAGTMLGFAAWVWRDQGALGTAYDLGNGW